MKVSPIIAWTPLPHTLDTGNKQIKGILSKLILPSGCSPVADRGTTAPQTTSTRLLNTEPDFF